MIHNATSVAIFAWGSSLAALIAWVFVFWVAWHVWVAEDVLVLKASDVEQATAREISLARLHTLVRETKEERALLRRHLSVDVLHAVSVIEMVGVASGVDLEVDEASTEGGVDERTATRLVSLVIRANDTFARLVHTVALLETLPVPSELLYLELEKAKNAADVWTLLVRARIVVSSSNDT